MTFEAETALPVLAATRLKDTQGFNGGEFIDDGTSVCTSGPPVYNPGTGEQAILTDGHCSDWTKYDEWYNDDGIDSDDCGYTGPNCTKMGSVQHLAAFGSGWDTGLISQPGVITYSDLDWENYQPYDPPGNLDGFSNPQETYSTSVDGELVCPSGAYEGMVCGTEVLYADQTETFSSDKGNETVHDVDRAQNTSQIPVGGGDSGGPVFTTPPNHLNVEGVILARGDAIECVNYNYRGEDCSYTIYYEDFESLMKDVWTGWELKTS